MGITILNVLTTLGTLLSGAAAFLAVYVVYRIHKKERLLEQRQLLLPLWKYMASLKRIDPSAPIGPDIVRSVNTLELVSFCAEGEIIDPAVIKRTFADVFIRQYDAIIACTEVSRTGKSGRDLLRENRATMSFYDQLMEDYKKGQKLIP
jgi:hypothetical protein